MSQEVMQVNGHGRASGSWQQDMLVYSHYTAADILSQDGQMNKFDGTMNIFYVNCGSIYAYLELG